MSEKPFWEGKTCEEMAGLHVKATWKNGTIVTGVLDDTGDIDLGDNRSLYTSRSYDSSCDFEPIDNIQSIELLDDPEYERIDNIENVQVGDIACTTEGNHFRVIDLKPDPLGDMLLRIRISEIDGEYCIDSDDFAYALRRKPKLPDHDGLWLDKDNALWSVAISGLDNSKLVALLIGDPESPRHRVCLVGPQQQARDLSSSVPSGQGGGSMNIHPIIDEPPSFPQTVLRLLTGSTHCCDWCEKRWIKVHRTGQLECRNRRCPYCGQYGCPRAEKHWKKCPVWNHMTPPAWLYPVLNRLCERDLQRMAKKSRNDA